MHDPSNDFEKLLNCEDITEPECQDFLERHSELMIIPFRLNHGIHCDSLISKFPLDTTLITDFAYLTKSTAYWHIVLVELESPTSKLFTENRKQITPSAELTKGLAQIDSWRDFIAAPSDEVLRRISPIRKPLSQNRVKFRYVLIIGRDKQLQQSQKMRNRWATLSKDDFELHTYDTLLRHYRERRPKERLRWNILSLSKDRFTFKYLHHKPFLLFDVLKPEDLELKPEHRDELISWKYDIPRWERGERRTISFRMRAVNGPNSGP